MNKVVLIGRLTRDPELRFAAGSGVAVTTFTLAVDRDFKNREGQYEADFIPIVCWRKLAEIVAENLSKGRLVAVSGRIQTRNYEGNDGQRRYVTEIVADGVQFLEKKETTKPQQNSMGDFFPIDRDDEIPF